MAYTAAKRQFDPYRYGAHSLPRPNPLVRVENNFCPCCGRYAKAADYPERACNYCGRHNLPENTLLTEDPAGGWMYLVGRPTAKPVE